jgi:hypothetical protein
MRLRTALLLPLALIVLISSPSAALEKTAVRASDRSQADSWTSGMTCTLVYYNTCTGWIWVWRDWEPYDVFGVAFEDAGSPSNVIESSSFYAWSAAPSGWGFTGTIGVYEADESQCPTGPPIDSQVWHPITGWSTHLWSAAVGTEWVVAVTLGSLTDGFAFHTDHPAMGPTGPQACGHCYPSPRPNHSFRWGTPSSPLCPGSPFFDGVCDAQLWFRCSYVGENCGPVPVEDASWTTIKALYR